MQQLVFPLGVVPAPTFESFVTGRNSEVVAALRAFATASKGEHSVYLWGPPGSGKSHLLTATIALAVERGAQVLRLPESATDGSDHDLFDNTLVVIDDVERLSAAEQAVLFNVYNAVRERSARLIATGAVPAAQLPLRHDVNTRLSWGLVYQLHALSDDEKVTALKQHSSGRGFALPDDVAAYLIRHGRRDLPWLMAVLNALDQHSLSMHRAITLPLLREVLDSAGNALTTGKQSETGIQ